MEPGKRVLALCAGGNSYFEFLGKYESETSDKVYLSDVSYEIRSINFHSRENHAERVKLEKSKLVALVLEEN